jgi:hypothetical protein
LFSGNSEIGLPKNLKTKQYKEKIMGNNIDINKVWKELYNLTGKTVMGELDKEDFVLNFIKYTNKKYEDASFIPLHIDEKIMKDDIVTEYNEVLMYVNRYFGLDLHQYLKN